MDCFAFRTSDLEADAGSEIHPATKKYRTTNFYKTMPMRHYG